MFVILVFFSGGSARSDVTSLMVLRPAATILCGIGLLTIKSNDTMRHWLISAALITAAAFAALTLLPVPESYWLPLPGREIIMDVGKSAGLHDVWRPSSTTPVQSLNAFWAVSIPAAVLLIGVQLAKEEQFLLLHVMITLILLSGLLSIFQVSAGESIDLYLYAITNTGSAVGLFANRNHQAISLSVVIPMLYVFALLYRDQSRFGGVKTVGAILVGLALIPLLLVTGSRAGLILGIAGAILAVVFLRKPNGTKHGTFTVNLQILAGLLGATILIALTILASRAEAIDRLFNESEGSRLNIWETSFQAGINYFPLGSGAGSFIHVFQLTEKDNELGSFYVNQAHNDFLDLFIVGGLPALTIFLFCTVCFILAVVKVLSRRQEQNSSLLLLRMGLIIITLIALASIGDYPARTPIVTTILAIAMLWISHNFNTADN